MIEQGNFKVQLLAHSVNPVGDEAISWATCYERFLHGEVTKHRWSRNASSSRAIPWKRMAEWTMQDPALPLHLGTNRPGMVSGAEIEDREGAIRKIRQMLGVAVEDCNGLVADFNLHKEIVNRYLEPWGWINDVLTMGRPQLMNFFKLRCDAYAHPNIQRLAVNMARLYRASMPKRLKAGEWHLPFITDEERVRYSDEQSEGWVIDGIEPDPVDMPHGLLVWSVARCAWTSYQTVDGKVATWEKAKTRHDDCVRLKHVTPCEPQLRARSDHGRNGGCVAGYDSYRHMIPDESASDFDFSILDTVYADRDFVIP